MPQLQDQRPIQKPNCWQPRPLLDLEEAGLESFLKMISQPPHPLGFSSRSARSASLLHCFFTTTSGTSSANNWRRGGRDLDEFILGLHAIMTKVGSYCSPAKDNSHSKSNKNQRAGTSGYPIPDPNPKYFSIPNPYQINFQNHRVFRVSGIREKPVF